MRCEYCDSALGLKSHGPAPRFCSNRCRVAARRSRGSLPAEMTDRITWTRADGKRPIRCDGFPASSTDPSTWASYSAAKASTAGDGFGIMLGEGLGCYDLDHALIDGVLTAPASWHLAAITEPIIFTEVSRSGDGLHIFVAATEGPGIRRPGFERYTRARFIRTTGRVFALPALVA